MAAASRGEVQRAGSLSVPDAQAVQMAAPGPGAEPVPNHILTTAGSRRGQAAAVAVLCVIAAVVLSYRGFGLGSAEWAPSKPASDFRAPVGSAAADATAAGASGAPRLPLAHAEAGPVTQRYGGELRESGDGQIGSSGGDATARAPSPPPSAPPSAPSGASSSSVTRLPQPSATDPTLWAPPAGAAQGPYYDPKALRCVWGLRPVVRGSGPGARCEERILQTEPGCVEAGFVFREYAREEARAIVTQLGPVAVFGDSLLRRVVREFESWFRQKPFEDKVTHARFVSKDLNEGRGGARPLKLVFEMCKYVADFLRGKRACGIFSPGMNTMRDGPTHDGPLRILILAPGAWGARDGILETETGQLRAAFEQVRSAVPPFTTIVVKTTPAYSDSWDWTRVNIKLRDWHTNLTEAAKAAGLPVIDGYTWTVKEQPRQSQWGPVYDRNNCTRSDKDGHEMVHFGQERPGRMTSIQMVLNAAAWLNAAGIGHVPSFYHGRQEYRATRVDFDKPASRSAASSTSETAAASAAA